MLAFLFFSHKWLGAQGDGEHRLYRCGSRKLALRLPHRFAPSCFGGEQGS